MIRFGVKIVEEGQAIRVRPGPLGQLLDGLDCRTATRELRLAMSFHDLRRIRPWADLPLTQASVPGRGLTDPRGELSSRRRSLLVYQHDDSTTLASSAQLAGSDLPPDGSFTPVKPNGGLRDAECHCLCHDSDIVAGERRNVKWTSARPLAPKRLGRPARSARYPGPYCSHRWFLDKQRHSRHAEPEMAGLHAGPTLDTAVSARGQSSAAALVAVLPPD